MTFELADKEEANGSIAGSDYGSRVRIMARSPTCVLFNALGCQYWDRNKHGGWHSLRSLFKDRPTRQKFEEQRAKLDELFGPGAAEAVLEAWRYGKTVLVDGGGDRMPLPNRTVALITRAEYAKIAPDWRADLSGEIKRCKQCDSELKPSTDHHRLGDEPLPDHPRTPEDCQRMTNTRVIAVHGYGTHASKDKQRLIARFETWDGESYLDEDFCSDKCAAAYGRRAAREREPLEPNGPVPETPHRPREDVDHYDVEAAAKRRYEQITAMFPNQPIPAGFKV